MITADFRYAVRTLIAGRVFTAVAVTCLALAIATNTTMFSVFDAPGAPRRALQSSPACGLTLLCRSRTGARGACCPQRAHVASASPSPVPMRAPTSAAKSA